MLQSRPFAGLWPEQQATSERPAMRARDRLDWLEWRTTDGAKWKGSEGCGSGTSHHAVIEPSRFEGASKNERKLISLVSLMVQTCGIN